MKKDNGITLIALIVSIIVLIILASIAINTLVNNEIIDKAKTATQEYKNAQDYEETQIAKYTNEIDSYVGGNRNENNFEIFTTEFIPNSDKTITIEFNKNIVGEYCIAIDMGNYIKGDIQYIQKYNNKIDVRLHTKENTNDTYTMKIYLYKKNIFPIDIVGIPNI